MVGVLNRVCEKNHIKIGNVKINISYYLWLIIFRVLLDLNYKHIIQPIFRIYGFLNNESPVTRVVSYIVLLLGAALFYKDWRNNDGRFSYEVLWILFLIAFVPFTSLMAFGMVTRLFGICNIAYWMVFVVVLNYVKFRGCKINRTIDKATARILLLIMIFSGILLTIYVSWKYARFRLNFRFDNVYDLRGEAADYNLPRALAYLYAANRMLLILIASIGAYKKNISIYFMAAGCVLLSFGIDGTKSIVFNLLLATGVFFVRKLSIQLINYLSMIGLSLLMLLSLLENKIFSTYYLAMYLVRRTFYVPTFLETAYFDYFHGRIPDFFRSSFLRHFGLVSPYGDLKGTISTIYQNMPKGSANNGLISDAIVNLGYVGLIVFPILLVFVLKIYDYFSKNIPSPLIAVWAFFLSVLLDNSFLFTVLLTHGGIVMMLCMGIYNRGMMIRRSNPKEMRINYCLS